MIHTLWLSVFTGPSLCSCCRGHHRTRHTGRPEHSDILLCFSRSPSLPSTGCATDPGSRAPHPLVQSSTAAFSAALTVLLQHGSSRGDTASSRWFGRLLHLCANSGWSCPAHHSCSEHHPQKHEPITYIQPFSTTRSHADSTTCGPGTNQ